MFHRLLSLALIAATVATTAHALAQELSIEQPVGGDGQPADLGWSPNAANELPKASGFPELTEPDEPPLPYFKEDDETIVLPPPASAEDPEPAKPVVKLPAQPVVTPAPAREPKVTVTPKPAVPLPRAKPKSIAKQPTPARKAALPKSPAAKKPVRKKPVVVTPAPDNKAPQDTDIEINQLEAISQPPARTAQEADSGHVLDIPIVGVEVAPAPEGPATPQGRKSNRVDRN